MSTFFQRVPGGVRPGPATTRESVMIIATPVYDQRNNLVCVHKGDLPYFLDHSLGWQELDGKMRYVTRVRHNKDGRSKVWVDTTKVYEEAALKPSWFDHKAFSDLTRSAAAQYWHYLRRQCRCYANSQIDEMNAQILSKLF